MEYYKYLKFRKYKKNSYSQCGEDLIVDYIFSARGILKPTYIDIGAHHPYYISNTALFYSKGSSGINIEPNHKLFLEFIKFRKKDINLNIGIGPKVGYLDFYNFSSSTMSTYSKEFAETLVSKHGMTILKKQPVEIETLPNIIIRYCNKIFPDFLSLDAEGLDCEILKSIDYNETFPKVICVETISYSTTGRGKKDLGIIDFLKEKDYILYADTYINSIFVRKAFWEQ